MSKVASSKSIKKFVPLPPEPQKVGSGFTLRPLVYKPKGLKPAQMQQLERLHYEMQQVDNELILSIIRFGRVLHELKLLLGNKRWCEYVDLEMGFYKQITLKGWINVYLLIQERGLTDWETNPETLQIIHKLGELKRGELFHLAKPQSTPVEVREKVIEEIKSESFDPGIPIQQRIEQQNVSFAREVLPPNVSRIVESNPDKFSNQQLKDIAQIQDSNKAEDIVRLIANQQVTNVRAAKSYLSRRKRESKKIKERTIDVEYSSFQVLEDISDLGTVENLGSLVLEVSYAQSAHAFIRYLLEDIDSYIEDDTQVLVSCGHLTCLYISELCGELTPRHQFVIRYQGGVNSRLLATSISVNYMPLVWLARTCLTSTEDFVTSMHTVGGNEDIPVGIEKGISYYLKHFANNRGIAYINAGPSDTLLNPTIEFAKENHLPLYQLDFKQQWMKWKNS